LGANIIDDVKTLWMERRQTTGKNPVRTFFIQVKNIMTLIDLASAFFGVLILLLIYE
jgi:hypothetical protein